MTAALPSVVLVLRTVLPAGTRLPIARYRFTFRIQDDLRLPEYAGSLLRGQFARRCGEPRRTTRLARAGP